MSQSRKMSIFETFMNVGSGLASANLCWWYIILPLYPKLNQENAGNIFIVNLIFTGISIIRGYFWRRCFNYFQMKKVLN